MAMRKSFTLIEIIVVIVLIGIAAGIAVGLQANLGGIRVVAAAQKIKEHIRYAQSYALATQQSTVLDFNPDYETYNVRYEVSAGSWFFLKDPLTNQDLSVDLAADPKSRANLIGSNFNGGGKSLLFDRLGEPYAYDSASDTAQALAATGNITLNDNVVIYVEPVTGMVTVSG